MILLALILCPLKQREILKIELHLFFASIGPAEKLYRLFKSKSKKQPLIEVFRDKNKNILAYFCGQAHATNDGKTMVAWIKNVFSKRNNPTRRCILTMDNVKFHHSAEVKAALKEQKVKVSHFPANTTCRLQPLDHSINGVFKNKLDKYWNEYMDSPDLPRTKAGNLRRPTRIKILEWITRAFAELKTESIQNSFNSCWMCKRKNDLVEVGPSEEQPNEVKPEQAALCMAIVPIPAVTDISSDVLQAATTTTRHAPIAARSPIYGPLPAPWTVTCPTIVPLMPISNKPITIADDGKGSDYGDNDSDREALSSDSDDYSGDEYGDEDSDDGGSDDDDDAGGDENDADSADDHISPGTKRKRRSRQA